MKKYLALMAIVSCAISGPALGDCKSGTGGKCDKEVQAGYDKHQEQHQQREERQRKQENSGVESSTNSARGSAGSRGNEIINNRTNNINKKIKDM
jgi:hypothetical protein